MQRFDFSAQNAALVPWRTSADRVWVKDLGTSDEVSLQLVCCAPGARLAPHRHAKPEFIFVLAGSAIQAGVPLYEGWAGIAAAGTQEDGFESPDGCIFLMVAAA